MSSVRCSRLATNNHPWSPPGVQPCPCSGLQFVGRSSLAAFSGVISACSSAWYSLATETHYLARAATVRNLRFLFQAPESELFIRASYIFVRRRIDANTDLKAKTSQNTPRITLEPKFQSSDDTWAAKPIQPLAPGDGRPYFNHDSTFIQQMFPRHGAPRTRSVIVYHLSMLMGGEKASLTRLSTRQSCPVIQKGRHPITKTTGASKGSANPTNDRP